MAFGEIVEEALASTRRDLEVLEPSDSPFTFCYHYKNGIWHIRLVAPGRQRDWTGLCGSEITCDVGIGITAARLDDSGLHCCRVCRALYLSRFLWVDEVAA